MTLRFQEYYVPMATTEGALVASTTRGCKAITVSGGTHTEILDDGITRAPVIKVPDVKTAMAIKNYVEKSFGEVRTFFCRVALRSVRRQRRPLAVQVAAVFNSTSRFARLKDIKVFIAGCHVYLRFKCASGDAMGMNMVGKVRVSRCMAPRQCGLPRASAPACAQASEKAIMDLATKFPMEVLSLSGNVCTDKKSSAVNWVHGRGKSVVCEATINRHVVESVLKSSYVDAVRAGCLPTAARSVDAMVNLNYSKNLLGSAVAGSLGGFNAHAANVVTATFLAMGQDPAQNVESSSWCVSCASAELSSSSVCSLTLLEKTKDGDLHASVTMPSLEVGTVGGGTNLPGQVRAPLLTCE